MFVRPAKQVAVRAGTMAMGTAILLLVAIFSGNCLGQPNIYLENFDAGLFDPGLEPVSVSYTLTEQPDMVEVLVEDFRSKAVDRMFFPNLEKGPNSFTWSGLDKGRAPFTPGSYRFVITVTFQDGKIEKEFVQFRIMQKAPSTFIPAPKLPPQPEFIHKIDGFVSWNYVYDERGEKAGSNINEGRARLHFNLASDGTSVDTDLFGILDRYGNADLKGSSAEVQRNWSSGKAQAIFRRDLGEFNDPMTLYSGYLSERKKYGGRLDQTFNMINFSLLGYDSEKGVDSDEKGAAGRLTIGDRDGWCVGATWIYKNAMDRFVDEKESAADIAMDIGIPITADFRILGEAVRSRNIRQENDHGWYIGGGYDNGSLRANAGYIYLGEDYEAPFADTLRKTDRDVQGFDGDLDYSSHTPVGPFRSIAISARMSFLKRISINENVIDTDGSVRFRIGSQDAFLLSTLYYDDDIANQLNLRSSYTHDWNREFYSGLESSFSRSPGNRFYRAKVDTGFRNEILNWRIALEGLRNETRNLGRDSTEEIGVSTEIGFDNWKFILTGRYQDTYNDHGLNIFGRVEYTRRYLHRYTLTLYTVLGDISAIKTTGRIEVGAKIQF